MPTRQIVTALALLWLAGNALRLTILSTPPVIPLIHDDLHMSATQVGILAAIPIVMFACAALPGSLLIARFGASNALIVGLLVCALGSALRGLSPDALTLFATTALMGAGVAIMQPSMPPLVRQWMPDRIGFGTAVFTNGLLVGEILPVALTLTVLVPLVGGWRLAFAAWAIPVVLIALAVIFLRPRNTQPKPATPPKWWPDWRSSLIWKLGLTFGTVNAMYFAANGFIPDYLTRFQQPEFVSLSLTALNVGQLPASFILLGIAQKIQGRIWPFIFGGALSIVGVIGIVMSSGYWFVFWAGILGFCCAWILVLALALPALLCAPEEIARTSAGMFTISYGFAIIIPILSGLAWDLSGDPRFAFLPLALCAVFLVVLPGFYKFEQYRPG